MSQTSRRDFIKQASVIGAAALTLPVATNAAALTGSEKDGDGYTFLFQGDSITDGNRTRNTDWNHVLGHGYAYLIAARLWYNLPEKHFHFFNRGISGNTVPDLAARWDTDTIAIKPNLLSILVGINDTNRAVNGDKNFTVAGYEEGMRALLKQTIQQLPGVQLVICEPFMLPVGNVKAKWDDYLREVTPRQQIAKAMAAEFDAVYVPLQDAFTKAAEQHGPADYWMWDGIHPMPNGHELMAREWIKQVSKKLKFIR
jgi:lysophospholipase L1-like esterase